MKDTGDQHGEEEHAHDDEGGHHEGDDVLLRGEQVIDRVLGGVRGLHRLQLLAVAHHQHLERIDRVNSERSLRLDT